jgi:hypothetical protein
MAGFDFAGSEATASDTVQKQIMFDRQSKAYNALAQVYGPEAGDPDLAAKLQTNYFNRQMDPLKVQSQDLTNQGDITKNATATFDLDQAKNTANREAGVRVLNLLKSHVKPDGSVDPNDFDSTVTPDMQKLLNIQPDQAAALRGMLSQKGGSAHLDLIESSLMLPTKVSGAGTVVLNPDGKTYSIVKTDQFNNAISTPINGTPALAAAALTGAGAKAVTADTAVHTAGARDNNSAAGPGDAAPLPGPTPRAPGMPASDGGATAIPGSTITGTPAVAAPPSAAAGADGRIPLLPNGQAPPSATAPSIVTGGASPVTARRMADATTPGGTLPSDQAAPTPAAIDAKIAQMGIDGALKSAKTGAEYNAIAARYNAVQGHGGPVKPVTPPSAFDKLPHGSVARGNALFDAQSIADMTARNGNIHSIIDSTIPQINAYSAGTGSWLKVLPASLSRNLQENLETIKGMGFLTAVSGMKNAKGQTGTGRLLQSEVPMLQKAFGNVDQDQSVSQLLFHLKLFRAAVDGAVARSRGRFTSQWGTSPEHALGLNSDGSANDGGAAPGTPSARPVHNPQPGDY